LPVPGFLNWPNSSPLDPADLGFLDPYWPFGIAAAVDVDGFSQVTDPSLQVWCCYFPASSGRGFDSLQYLYRSIYLGPVRPIENVPTIDSAIEITT
jgi:hypothetical protein